MIYPASIIKSGSSPFFSMVWREKRLPLLRFSQAAYRLARKAGMGAPLKKLRVVRRNDRPQDQENTQKILDYDELWNAALSLPADPRMLSCAFPDWDNSPRTDSGYRCSGASPEKFGRYTRLLCEKIRRENALPLLFVNAWNEWGEGAYLEPDEAYRDQYLRALSDALKG